MDGSTFAEGLLSKGLDRVVWTAPSSEGADPIRVEVFPSAPQVGSTYSFTSPVSQDLKVMVIATPGGSVNDFADPMAFYSLLKLDGSFDDVGTRPRSVQPEAFGSPALDTYSSGFGYRFGPSAGVRVPGLMPPGSRGSLAAFSVLLRLDSDQGDGVLLRFASDDGGYSLVLGLKDYRPYVETQAAGQVQRSTGQAQIPLPRFPATLQASFSPEGDRLAVVWYAEGERIDSPLLALPPAPPAGSAQLGGAHSLPGVYDGFGMMVNSASPSYRLASRRKWKGSLVIAESFEDGALPPLSHASGPVSVDLGSLSLGSGAVVTLAPVFGIASTLIVEADTSGGGSSCDLVISNAEQDPIVTVSGSGEVRDGSGQSLGSIAAGGGRLAFRLDLLDGSLRLRGSDNLGTYSVATTAKRFLLSLGREGDGEAAVFERVLVRSTQSVAAKK